MYQVNLGDKALYYPASEDAAIYDTEWIEDIGQAGNFVERMSSHRYWRRSHCTVSGWDKAREGTGLGHIRPKSVFNIYRTHAAMCTVTD